MAINNRIVRPLEFDEVRTYSARERMSAFDPARMARVTDVRQPMDLFLSCLPRYGQATQLLEAAECVVMAAAAGRQGVWIIDAAALERGLAPLLIRLMELNLVQHLALDLGATIRDFETAFFGQLKEDATGDLREGVLGMARETAEWMNGLINEGARRGFGIGYSLGRGILDRRAPFDTVSLLANAAGLRVPLTVHVEMGADGIQMHQSADPTLLGKGTFKDFQFFGGQVAELGDGGVVVALTGDTYMPRMFQKALSMSRNQGRPVERFFGVQFNNRPICSEDDIPLRACTGETGRFFQMNGPMELTGPLFFSAIQRYLR